jgi:hypothetical protein
MASFGKRLTRFAAAQTIYAVQIRILRVLGKGLFSAHDLFVLFAKPDHALWPKLQGKLNREYTTDNKGTSLFWQSARGL